MTAYEIVSVFIGILALLIAFGGFVIALLAFLEKRNKHKKYCLSCLIHKRGSVRKDILTYPGASTLE